MNVHDFGKAVLVQDESENRKDFYVNTCINRYSTNKHVSDYLQKMNISCKITA